MNHPQFEDHKGILEEVLNERTRQDAKFGKYRHQHPFLWGVILTEETGEVAKAAIESEFNDEPIEDYRKELIQVAAVAIAAVQDLDRNGRYYRNAVQP